MMITYNNQCLRFLALGPQDVYPPLDGGKEGIYGALAALAVYAEVIYAYPSCEVNVVTGYEKIKVSPLPLKFQPEEGPSLILRATLSGKSYKFEKYNSKKALVALDAALPKTAVFDAIICHHAHTYGLARRLTQLRGWSIPIVVREHNIEYAVVESYQKSLKGGKRALVALFAWLTRRQELKIWQQASAVAFLSDQDLRVAKAAANSGSSRLFLAREGVPLPRRRSIRYPGPQAPLLVLLNPRASQGVINLREFVHRYWLPLRKKNNIVDEVLHVTGVNDEQLAKIIGLDIAKLNEYGIKGLGFLPSLTATFEQALALISPTFIGGGIRKKVLEAMAHQLPVIATEIDIASCDYFKPYDNILPMVNILDFAKTVRRLREDQAHWLDLSVRARETVEQFASWEQYGEAMFDVINVLAKDKEDCNNG